MSGTGIDDEGAEPYTSERLATIQGGYRNLTEVFKVMDLDFNDPKVSEQISNLRSCLEMILLICSDFFFDFFIWFFSFLTLLVAKYVTT